MLINYNKLKNILQSDPLWYLDSTLDKVVSYFYHTPKNNRPKNFNQQKEDFKLLIQKLLQEERIIIGKREEYFNDDDREAVTTAVIHHTSTKKDVGIEYINAIQLFTLYYPIYKNGFGKVNNKYLPISSGHFYKGKETFIGYHYLVYEDGKYIKTLKDDYVGFHSGDYKTNCKSIGIAFVGSFDNSYPTQQALSTTKSIIQKYNIKNVLGHKEVLFKGKTIDTISPGNKWEEWKSDLKFKNTK